ncbi:hypothetical protein E4T56_gene15008 [Termitomyces sp. T112]|nr:hypothetical protein E4T56_gene15008 [Termitomyces sp. T112]
MIQGFRNIIDDLLVFAPLFSAVVATFAARTSQTLQPDNTQIWLLYSLKTLNNGFKLILQLSLEMPKLVLSSINSVYKAS